MECNCNLVHTILAIIVIMFAWWPGGDVSKWVLTIVGILILLHAWKCKNCKVNMTSVSSRGKKARTR